MPKIRFISDVQTASKHVIEILKHHPIVGLCCKLSRLGHVSLIAIGTDDDTVRVFDVKSGRAVLFDSGLHRILQSSDVLKVMHDCPHSISALLKQHGVHLRHVFDTQVAYSVVLQCEDLPPRQVTLPALCDKIGIPLDHPDSIHKLLNEDGDVWMRRPLSPGLVNAIVSEASPLYPRLYSKLVRAIHPSLLPWFEAMNFEQIQSGYRPCQVKKTRCARVRLDEMETAKEKPITRLTKRQTILLSNTIPIQRK